MEEVLVVLAQFLLEILFPLLAELFVNFVADTYWPEGTKLNGYLLLIFIAGGLGAMSGAIPSPIANHPVVQAAVVLVGPFLLAEVAERIFRRREMRGKSRPDLGHFWKVYWFAFPFLLMRSIVIHHQTLRTW